jgi:ubiquinone/menaquinone biosynthesis C-methylase UbiE
MQPEDYAFLYELEENFWWFAGMREITAAVLDPVICAPAPRMILDAGCGTGGMLSWLDRHAGNGCITGIDLSSIGLGFCRTRGHKMLAQASVTDLPFSDSTFDLVTSFDIWEQLPGEGSDEAAAREMFRVLRPGGIAFVRVPAYEWMKSGHDKALATQHRYGLNELVRKMSNAGFKIRRATYANTLLLPLAVIRRLLLQRIGVVKRGSDVKPMPASLGWLNRILLRALRAEARLLSHPERTLPFGLSAICLAEKPRA